VYRGPGIEYFRINPRSMAERSVEAVGTGLGRFIGAEAAPEPMVSWVEIIACGNAKSFARPWRTSCASVAKAYANLAWPTPSAGLLPRRVSGEPVWPDMADYSRLLSRITDASVGCLYVFYYRVFI
jgi:hypothetical protein